MMIRALMFFAFLFSSAETRMINFEDDFGAIPNDSSHHACETNTKLLSDVLQNHASNSTILLVAENTTLHFYNGVYGSGLSNSHFVIDGTLRFERKPHYHKVYQPPPCFMIANSKNVTFTSTGRGLLDGHGSAYWGIPYIGYAELIEDRPRLFKINTTSDLLIENLIFKDSPYHTVYMDGVQNVVVRYVSIVARRTHGDGHSWIDLSAFNTDGLDVSGSNVHVHDVDIWVQDDCIAVKDNYFEPYVSSDMLFERVNCSGVGLVLGSIGGTHVRNITFRDAYLHKSVKGIYLKFRKPEPLWNRLNMTGSISDITFHNISMEAPLQWPIWIGPAQQADAINPCEPNPCSLCWPEAPFAQCHVVPKTTYSNITLRNVGINNPRMSAGVILGGDDHTSIEGMLFDNVRIRTGDPDPRARIPRTVTFPGLLEPIDDEFVAHILDIAQSKEPLLMMGLPKASDAWFQILLMVIVALVVTLHVYVWAKRRRKVVDEDDDEEEATDDVLADDATSTSTETESSPLLPRPEGRLFSSQSTKRLFLWFWVAEVVLIITIVSSQNWITPNWKKLNRYYRCEGVVDGIATKDTWPVPYCFKTLDDERVRVA